MTMWRVQSGPLGELESAIDHGAVAIPWNELPDLSRITSKDELTRLYQECHSDQKAQQITLAVGQIWAFLQRVQVGDWVVMPLKRHPAIAIGTVESGYEYRSDLGRDAHHTRRVKWIQKRVPREKFEQDLLYAFRGILAVCQLSKNSAEARIRKIVSD